MEKRLTVVAAVVALFTGIIGTTVAVDQRYAKSAEVEAQFAEARRQQLRDRIFELDLKPAPTAADKALRGYLQQQLNDTK
mgnify:CR=1 FL=1